MPDTTCFVPKNGEIESHQMPACPDCFVNMQYVPITKLVSGREAWRATSVFQVPSGNGWMPEATNGRQDLVIDWMEGKPVPGAVSEISACKCARSCKLPQCICLSNGLKCTELCKLKDCDNQPQKR